jgi:predicted methyltransferase MtxX (methanogen marker protein 4)
MTRALYEVRGRANMSAGMSTLVRGAVAVAISDTDEIEEGMHFLLTPDEARRVAKELHSAAMAADFLRRRQVEQAQPAAKVFVFRRAQP